MGNAPVYLNGISPVVVQRKSGINPRKKKKESERKREKGREERDTETQPREREYLLENIC